ncbi:MAG: hypothetical protein JXA21_02495 [Anaerolineae bacterium]|nr:hypothetical protein [Anaerolineae bacterium]
MDVQPGGPYIELNDDQVVPLLETAPTLAGMDAAMVSIMRMQRVLDRLPVLRSINLVDWMQRLTPASVQEKIAAKKALQTAQYLGKYNRACIAFWREHGITDLAFLDSLETLRRLPVMTAEFFYHYSPQDRLSIGDPESAQLLQSSGTTGHPKYFLMSDDQVFQTLPAMREFLKANWQIDRYQHVEVIMATATAQPGQPTWGAGYNMAQLLSLISKEYDHITYRSLGLNSFEIAQNVREVAKRASGKTLIAVYTYAPYLVAIVNELKATQSEIDFGEYVDFKFTLTGEALPPYKLFQVAEWLGLIDADLVSSRIDDIAAKETGCRQLGVLARVFSTGFGAAELKTGFSGNSTTMLWTLVMYLLERNEPERVRLFLAKYFHGNSFPWSALKSNPNVYFLLGDVDESGKPSLRDFPGEHYGLAFATCLQGELVNCPLDMMYLWDLNELAHLLKVETGVDIKAIARRAGISYDKGQMVLTNGRIDNVGNQGLDAAVAFGGTKIFGYHLQRAAAKFPGLTGRFVAQNVDYADGRRTLWLYFEANVDQDVTVLAGQVVPGIVEALDSSLHGFHTFHAQFLAEGGEALMARKLQIRVLPYGHERFAQSSGETKNRYIRRPLLLSTPLDIAGDPLEA